MHFKMSQLLPPRGTTAITTKVGKEFDMRISLNKTLQV